MNLPAYPKTKKSGLSACGNAQAGVEWLGDIPEHWEVRRLKFAAPLINDKVDASDSGLPYMGLEHIESWTGRRIPDADAASDGIATRFMPGDVLFGKLRPYLAKVYLADCEGVASTELLVLRSEKGMCPEFLRYYAASRDFIKAVDASTYGAKMPRANWEFIGNQPFLIPSPDEQRSIADFLDRKTGRIDELIGKKKELIGKLNEQRSALITHAVTKGLDDSAPLKDSGIAWLGPIPAQWKVMSLRRIIVSLDQGWSPQAGNNPAEPDEWGVLKLSAINKGRFFPEENKAFDSSSAKFCPLTPQAGDILLSRANTPALVGAACVVESDQPRRIIPDLMYRLRVDEETNCIRFIGWFLLSMFARAQIESDARGSSGSMVKVSQGHVLDWRVLLPPKEEQRAIAEYLDEKTGKIDGLIRKTATAIQTLEEYRTALITAAVTGKIDVRSNLQYEVIESQQLLAAEESVSYHVNGDKK